MDNESFKLKEKFEALYPEYARRLTEANEVDICDVYNSILAEKKREFAQLTQKSNTDGDYDYYSSLSLFADQYRRLVDAHGDGIEAIIKELMNKMDVFKKCASEGDNEVFAAQMYSCGVAAITPAGFEAFSSEAAKGTAITLAVLNGVAVVGLGAIVIALDLFILVIFIPFFYMKKPALAIIAVINELEEKLYYDSEYFEHGDKVGSTLEIPEAVVFPSKTVYNFGFFTGSKIKNALYGVQGAYALKIMRDDTKFTFGFDCPLTGIYTGNNCFCEINMSAKDACNKTDEFDKLEWTDEKHSSTYGMSIKCNSSKGSYAYYITRIYKK